MKYTMRMTGLFSLLIAMLIFAGCMSPFPVNQGPQVSSPAATPTPVVTPVVTGQQTGLPSNPVPEETEIPVVSYVKRPFGLVQYTYNPSHRVRLLESHMETGPTGTRMIVGTIKNIGPERIDLVVVTITLFNADGYAIGSTSSEVYYLEPDRVWKFRTTPFTMDDVKSHQVAEIFTG